MNTSVNVKHKILVVDDDLDVNTTIALMLEFDGHTVETVDTGEAALVRLRKSNFDLIITEYWLQLMKGDELAALVKEQWPDQPIIMATANSEEIHADHLGISGVDCLLNKPFSMLQLREAMLWVFARYAERRQLDLGTPEQPGVQLEQPDDTHNAPQGNGHR
jgi:DNA-binding response OmpR family regulator